MTSQYIRYPGNSLAGLIATSPLSFNSATSTLSLGYDNVTIKVNGSNQLYANSVTFPLLAPDGLVSAPSYSFTSQAGTGLYYSGGVMRFAKGGFECGYFTTDGSSSTVLNLTSSGTIAAAVAGTSNLGQTSLQGDATGGGSFRAYGASHASKASRLEFYNGTTLAGQVLATQRWTIGSTVTEGQVHTISAVDTLGANATHLVLSSGAAAQVPFKIAKDRNDGSINIAGGGASGNGGEIVLYGSTFGGGLSSQIRFLQTATQVGSIDSSNLWSIGKSGETGTHTLTGALNPSLGIIGVSTNSSAAAGTVGQFISSVVSGVNAGTTAQFSNVTSISLTAGDWDVTGLISTDANAATITGATQDGAISINSGNTTTDQVVGDNQAGANLTSATTGISREVIIPSYRMSLSATTTVYLKAKITYTGGPPIYAGRLSARRVR